MDYTHELKTATKSENYALTDVRANDVDKVRIALEDAGYKTRPYQHKSSGHSVAMIEVWGDAKGIAKVMFPWVRKGDAQRVKGNVEDHFSKTAEALVGQWFGKTAFPAIKNKRVLFNLEKTHLILDFRGDTGMTHQDPKQLQDNFRDFFIDVVNTEKALALPSKPSHSRIEVYNGTLGFLVSRIYRWDGIAEKKPRGGLGEYSIRDLWGAVKDGLSKEGWKVTR